MVVGVVTDVSRVRGGFTLPRWHVDAVSGRRPCHYQGRQERDPLDAAVLPRLSAQRSAAPAPRPGLQPCQLLRTLGLPEEVEHWSLTTLREKLVKIGARIVRHGRYVVFQLAEVAVPRSLFASILRRIDDLRPRPPPLAA